MASGMRAFGAPLWMVAALVCLLGPPARLQSRPPDRHPQEGPPTSGASQSAALSGVLPALRSSADLVFVLLADNSVLMFSGSSAVPVRTSLGPPPSEPGFAPHSIAISRDQSRLFILLARDARSSQAVAVIDTEARLLKTHSLPSDVVFR